MTIDSTHEVLRRLGGPDFDAAHVELADGHFRWRRGQLVRIPDEWVGLPAVLCCGDGMWRRWLWYRNPRASKTIRKLRMKRGWSPGGHRVPRDRYERAKQRGEPAQKHDPGHPKHFAPRHAGRRHQRRLHGAEE